MRQHDRPADSDGHRPNLRQGTHLYVDATRGIAGDMLLAALFDLGVPPEVVLPPLESALPPFRMTVESVRKRGITARSLRVDPLEDDPPHRTFRVIRALLAESDLSEPVRDRSIAVFEALAHAEAEVHGSSPEDVHFHEVGALDSLVDIVGVVIAIDWLAPTRTTFSGLALGSGTVETQHGVYPVPAPATLALLRGVPTVPFPVPREVTTPTGAVLAKILADDFGPPPTGIILSTGYGAGTREPAPEDPPNLLRAWTVEPTPSEAETISILETNVDHLSGEDIGHLIDRLLADGALDVFAVPYTGKKSRPGHLISVLAAPDRALELERKLFEEAGTLGIRRRTSERRALTREWVTVVVRGEQVRVKLGLLDGRPISVAPEYEDLRTLAQQTGLSVRTLRAETLAAHAAASDSPPADLGCHE